MAAKTGDGVLISRYADRRILKIILFAAVILAFGCHTQTEQDKIRKTITDIQEAAGEKDVKKILNNLSRTYHDSEGFDYDTIKGLLVGYFFRHKKIHVYITNLDASVEDTTGRAVFLAILSGASKPGTAADILPESLSMYSFDVSLKKENGDWKVTSARWERFNQKRE